LRFSRHLAAHTAAAAAAAAAARRAQGAEEEEEEEDSVRVAPKGGRSQNLKLVLQNQVYVGIRNPNELEMSPSRPSTQIVETEMLEYLLFHSSTLKIQFFSCLYSSVSALSNCFINHLESRSLLPSHTHTHTHNNTV
jgi:hypothetical protein